MRGRPLAALFLVHALEEQNVLHVLQRREHRDQVVGLEDEADVVQAHVRELPGRHVVQFAAGYGQGPCVGWSSPPIRFRSVVLPEPEGPAMAVNSPLLDGQVDAAEGLDLEAVPVVNFYQVVDGYDGHGVLLKYSEALQAV